LTRISLNFRRCELNKRRSVVIRKNGLLCHALGYVGEISPEQLKQPEYRDKGYKPGDIIGQEGLESVYDEYLRGRDGYRKVIVDSRGHIQNEVERVEPQSGQDIVITIDLDLQKPRKNSCESHRKAAE